MKTFDVRYALSATTVRMLNAIWTASAARSREHVQIYCSIAQLAFAESQRWSALVALGAGMVAQKRGEYVIGGLGIFGPFDLGRA